MDTAENFMVLDKDRVQKVNSILVSQPKPTDPNSPYNKLAEKYNLTIDFRQFIQIDPVDIREFRNQKINILDHTAVIFTSRNAVDHFFRLANESKTDIPSDMKYFCISEQTANYLHKYIVIRKRKIFVGERTASDLIKVISKHKGEKFIFPCSNIRTNDIPDFLNKNGYNWSEVIIYRTVAADLSDLDNVTYDIIAFFSPSGIDSLLQNFPNFKQNNTRIAAFGPTTSKSVRASGLILDIQAPLPNAPSMTGALEFYIKKANGK